MFLVNFYAQETRFFFLFKLTPNPLLWPFLTSLEHLCADSGASIPHHTGSLQLIGAVRTRDTGRGWLLDWCSINSDVRTCPISWWLGAKSLDNMSPDEISGAEFPGRRAPCSWPLCWMLLWAMIWMHVRGSTVGMWWEPLGMGDTWECCVSHLSSWSR